MTTSNLSPDVEDAVRLEERSHRLRAAMLGNRAFIAETLEGFEEAQRGETISLPELCQALGLS
jgi:hypothetical protein